MKSTLVRLTAIAVALLVLAACSSRDPMADMRRKMDTLASELPQINEAIETQKRLRSQGNGWEELRAAHAVIKAFEASEQGRSSWTFLDLNSADNTHRPDREEIARTGLAGTQAVATHMAAAAEFARVVPWDSSAEVMSVAVLPLLAPVEWAAARVTAHEILGDSIRAQDELRVLLKVVNRTAVPPTIVGTLVTFAVRIKVLYALLDHAGKPGWHRSMVTELLSEMTPFRPRYAQIFAAELAFVRELFAETEGEDMTVQRTPDVVRNLEKEYDTLAAGYGAVIREDAKTQLRLMRDADLRRVIELLKPLTDFPADDAIVMPAVQHSVLGVVTRVTHELMVLAAIELRLLESENGPLAKQRDAVSAVVKGVAGAAVEFRGDDAVLVADKNHWRYREAGMPEPDEVLLDPRK